MIFARVMWIIPFLCSSVWLATGLAWAQDETKRIELVLSKLPQQGTATYRAIKTVAGKATRQILALTKTELWSVPIENVEAVKRTAALRGVSVSAIGANWNQVFRSPPTDMTLSDRQETIVELAKASKATIAVGTTATAFPPIVEYALTREVASQAPASKATNISVALNDKTVLTITRTSVDIRSHMCIWRGTVDGTGAPVTLMWWPGGRMTGTIEHDGRIFNPSSGWSQACHR